MGLSLFQRAVSSANPDKNLYSASSPSSTIDSGEEWGRSRIGVGGLVCIAPAVLSPIINLTDVVKTGLAAIQSVRLPLKLRALPRGVVHPKVGPFASDLFFLAA